MGTSCTQSKTCDLRIVDNNQASFSKPVHVLQRLAGDEKELSLVQIFAASNLNIVLAFFHVRGAGIQMRNAQAGVRK